jgi:hypothetical protein
MDFSTPAKFIPSVFLNTGTTRPGRERRGEWLEEGRGGVIGEFLEMEATIRCARKEGQRCSKLDLYYWPAGDATATEMST